MRQARSGRRQPNVQRDLQDTLTGPRSVVDSILENVASENAQPSKALDLTACSGQNVAK